MIQHRNPSLPTLQQLKSMQPDEIGRAFLPLVARHLESNPHGFVPRDFARGMGNQGAGQFESDEYATLVAEGIGFLDRAGLLVDVPNQLGSHFFRLSRAGARAASDPAAPFSTVASQESRTLLHPRVAEAALGDLERGRPDIAVFAAFREPEIAVREVAGVTSHAKDTFYDAFAIRGKSRGPLVPHNMETGEVISLREMMAGAYGFSRNPSAHRNVQNDTQAMRLLIIASALFSVLEQLHETTE